MPHLATAAYNLYVLLQRRRLASRQWQTHTQAGGRRAKLPMLVVRNPSHTNRFNQLQCRWLPPSLELQNLSFIRLELNLYGKRAVRRKCGSAFLNISCQEWQTNRQRTSIASSLAGITYQPPGIWLKLGRLWWNFFCCLYHFVQ